MLGQTYSDFKLYVVDDGSTDDTEKVLKKYALHPKVTFLKQENAGVSAARNYGIKNSSSLWVAFIDSDDEWLTNKLEKQMSYAQSHPEIRFIHSNEIWMRDGVRVNAKKKFDKSNHEIFQRSLKTCLISPSTVVMRRDLLQAADGFDESFVVCEDYELWLRILAFEEVGFVEDELIKKYGGHKDQLSTTYFAMDYWRVKGLVQLLKNEKLSKIQKEQIQLEITAKIKVLKMGYLKHNNAEGLDKLYHLYPEAQWV